MAVELYYDWYIDKGKHYFRTTDVNQYEPGDYQKHNMLKVYAYFTAYGWTVNAIAGMLGNMMVESTVNPGIVQYASVDWDNPSTILSTSGGIGLTQWTPARKYYNWAIAEGLDPLQGDSQCARIEWERETNHQWSLNNLGHHTWEDFVHSTETPEVLARVFVWAYERPTSPNIAQRQRNARWVYDFLTQQPIPPGPEPPIGDDWIMGQDFATLAIAYDPDITGVDIPYSQWDCITYVNEVWKDIPVVSQNNYSLPLGTNTLWRRNMPGYPTQTYNTTSPDNQSPTPVLWWKGTISDVESQYGEIPAGCLLFHQISEAGPPAIPAQYAGDGIGNFAHVGIYIGNNEVMQSGGQDAGSVPGGGVHRSVYDPTAWNYAAFVCYVDCTNMMPGPTPPDPPPSFQKWLLLWYNQNRKKVLKNVKRSL